MKRKTVRETTINRLLNTHTESGYVMVSACRNDWVPYMDEEDPDQQEVLRIKNQEMNNKKTKEIKQDIYDSGFQYIPVRGGFIEQNTGVAKEEDSFIIVNYKRRSRTPEKDMTALKQLAIDLCGKYNQDSVLVVEPGKKPTYYKRDGSVDFEFSGSMTVRDNAQEFFTRLGKGRKFTFLECEDQPHTMNGAIVRRCKGEIVAYS